MVKPSKPDSAATFVHGGVRVNVSGGTVVNTWEMRRSGNTLTIRQVPVPGGRASGARGKRAEFVCDGSD